MKALPRRLTTLLFIASLSFSVHGQTEDDTVIAVDSSTVIMNATILDRNGSHVPGLKKAQFSIFEDGVEQQIDFFATEETPFAAVILLDSSGSMEERISLGRAAAIRFLDGLRPTDSAAIYRFDSKVDLVQTFSNSRDVTEKIFDVKSYGMTVLNDAVYKAAKDLETRPEKRRAIIVLSDGADTMSGRSADAALKAALASNAVIYTVDMSSPNSSAKQKMENAAALKKFAEKSGDTYVSTPGGVAMREAFEKIVAELGVQYTLSFSPSNIKKDGKWRALEMRVARPNLTIRTRKGYHAVKEK
jgi:Ca-activated chloride channel family protein